MTADEILELRKRLEQAEYGSKDYENLKSLLACKAVQLADEYKAMEEDHVSKEKLLAWEYGELFHDGMSELSEYAKTSEEAYALGIQHCLMILKQAIESNELKG